MFGPSLTNCDVVIDSVVDSVLCERGTQNLYDSLFFIFCCSRRCLGDILSENVRLCFTSSRLVCSCRDRNTLCLCSQHYTRKDCL